MSKRKSKNSHKPGAAASNVAKLEAKQKRAVSATDLAGPEGAELEATAESGTRLPEVPVQESEMKLPPVSPSEPAELESKPALSPHLAEPKPDVTPPLEAPAEAKELTRAVTDEAGTAGPSPKLDRPLRAIAGMEACQTLLMEMTRDNLDFAASLALMRSPIEIVDVATKFASKRIGMYSRFSKAVADIAVGRQAPMT
ncbi:hypothetical protein [Bradyrhizobium sp. STM 3557]|uniref:hypothetical protein n=1 Tax=Bradyrhizobium sp. STM 3557 TaxID=578920 RepID=UPI003890F98F